jgi:ADP-ribosylation factor-like protein 8
MWERFILYIIIIDIVEELVVLFILKLAVIFVVDASDRDNLKQAKTELDDLLSKDGLKNIPLLVLGNKNDINGSLKSKELVDALRLDDIKGNHLNFSFKDREVSCYSISAKNSVNIDITLNWLIKHVKFFLK